MDLSPERIHAVDTAGQLEDILGVGEHLRDAVWRVESAGLEFTESPGGLVVAGMGGSAIGGSLAAAVLGDRAAHPVLTVRGYQVPSWVDPDVTVLCASYSGNTEETLSAFAAAGERGARRIACTTGGELAERARAAGAPVIPLPAALQPRAAVGYMTVAVLQVAAACGAGPSMTEEAEAAAGATQALAERWREDGPAHELARALSGTVPVVSGAELTAPVAYRWKTQINENAKIPAFAGELPEVDHNEIVGWQGAADSGRFSAVFLDDAETDPRTRRRIELTRALIAEGAAGTHVVRSIGESRLERLLSLVLLGDLVSLFLAVLADLDPTPVAVIEDLKAQLADG